MYSFIYIIYIISEMSSFLYIKFPDLVSCVWIIMIRVLYDLP